ncbi:MAG: hypothetical protein OXQ29_16470 [Rhodospirillaceae bacterium]|nr:hypothetical protein [Rhodospirillaceae bacterium]
MIEHGLLLTPEWFEIPENPRAAKRRGEPPKTQFLQTRACFTLLSRNTLWETTEYAAKSHVHLFGDFVIGLLPSDARRLGALPVAYVYHAFDGTTGNQEDTVFPTEILFNLRELRSLAIAVARLEARAANPRRCVLDARALDRLGYVLLGDPYIRRRIDRVGRWRARRVMRLLDTDRVPAWGLVDMLDMLLGVFQTADFREVDSYGMRKQNSYYRQREWRILRVFASELRCQRLGSDHDLDGDRAMSDSERLTLRGRLKRLNSGFFDDERLEKSAIVRGLMKEAGGRQHFWEFVEEIICPSDAASAVESLMTDIGLERVETIERRDTGGERGEYTVFVRR